MKPGRWYYWSGKDLLLNVHIQTRAKRDEIGDLYNGRVKIHITAPPVAGKANKYLSAFLAQQFNLAQADVEIIKGTLSRDKLVKIHHPRTSPSWFHEFIQADINSAG